MSRTVKCILKCIFLTVVSSLAGMLLLTAVFLVPVNGEHKVSSLELLEEEGWYPASPMHKQAYSEYFHSYLPGVMDNNTDGIMISTALDEKEGNPFLRAMNMYSDHLKTNYARYWHGYVMLLRPLLFFFDYAEIRIINGFLQAVLMFFLTHLVWKKKGVPYAALMLTSYALLMPTALSVSFQFSWVFYIGALGCAALLSKTEYWRDRAVYLFLVIGLLTSYFDLLTYPLFTWGFPLVWWLLTDRDADSRWIYIKRCLYSGISWFAGYCGMWVMKWVLASLITGRNVIEEATEKVQEHSASLEEASLTFFSRLEAAYFNWKHYEYSVYMVLLVAWLLWLIIRSFRRGWRFHKNNAGLLIAAGASLGWYLALAEHTRGHHFFTYRIWNIAVLAVLGLLLQATERVGENEEGKRGIGLITDAKKGILREKVKILGVWAAAAVCGAVLTLTIREPLSVFNGGAESIKIPLSAQTVITTEFVPTFAQITEVGLVIDASNTEGYFEIILGKQGKELYREKLFLAQYTKDNRLIQRDVNWLLDVGGKYDMQIHPVDLGGKVELAVAVSEDSSLAEIRNMTLDGRTTGNSLIMSIHYHIMPYALERLLYLACCYGTVCVTVLLTGIDFIGYINGRRKKLKNN